MSFSEITLVKMAQQILFISKKSSQRFDLLERNVIILGQI